MNKQQKELIAQHAKYTCAYMAGDHTLMNRMMKIEAELGMTPTEITNAAIDQYLKVCKPSAFDKDNKRN